MEILSHPKNALAICFARCRAWLSGLMQPILAGVELEERSVRTTDGFTLSAKCAGPQDGQAILFLHGFPEFWYGWRKQIGYFAAQGYRVVAPDQRGYNDSDKPPQVCDYRIVQLAEDVAAMVKQLQLQECVLVGHDWGAVAAWMAAIRHPSLFARLVILNVPHPRVFIKTLFTNPMQFVKSWYMYFFQLPVLPAWVASFDGYRRFAEAMRSTANAGSFTDADLDAYIAAWQKPGAMDAMINWYRAAFRYPELAGPADVLVPTLILWGERDQFLEASMAAESLNYCRNGRVRYFPDATHWVQHDLPDAVNSEIEKFITQ